MNMDNRAIERLGFSMSEQSNNTILIKGVAQGNVSKKIRAKRERNFSKISLHLFDREYVERLQKVEVKNVNNNRSIGEKLALSVSKAVDLSVSKAVELLLK